MDITEAYALLGATEQTSDIDLEKLYKNAKKKYDPHIYRRDDPLRQVAASRFEMLDKAYRLILESRRVQTKKDSFSPYRSAKKRSDEGSQSDTFEKYGLELPPDGLPIGDHLSGVVSALRSDELSLAKKLLFELPKEQRGADWYYLESLILINDGSFHDGMKKLESVAKMPEGKPFEGEKKRIGKKYRRKLKVTSDAVGTCFCECCLEGACELICDIFDGI